MPETASERGEATWQSGPPLFAGAAMRRPPFAFPYGEGGWPQARRMRSLPKTLRFWAGAAERNRARTASRTAHEMAPLHNHHTSIAVPHRKRRSATENPETSALHASCAKAMFPGFTGRPPKSCVLRFSIRPQGPHPTSLRSATFPIGGRLGHSSGLRPPSLTQKGFFHGQSAVRESAYSLEYPKLFTSASSFCPALHSGQEWAS